MSNPLSSFLNVTQESLTNTGTGLLNDGVSYLDREAREALNLQSLPALDTRPPPPSAGTQSGQPEDRTAASPAKKDFLSLAVAIGAGVLMLGFLFLPRRR